MALLTSGYWPSTYWPATYWADDYWPDYGVVEPLSIIDPTIKSITPKQTLFGVTAVQTMISITPVRLVEEK